MGGLKGLDLVRHMQVRQPDHAWYQSKIQIVLMLFNYSKYEISPSGDSV
jgi:hypothetical protein